MHHSTDMPTDRLTPERRRELTRTALVDAAAEVFTRRGFHAASLDEIAEEAGFTRGAIYSNFGGKEDLLIAVLDLYTERQLTAFADAIENAASGTPEERTAAAAAVWSHLNRATSMSTLSLEWRLYASRNPAFRQRLAEAERRHQERIASFIEEVARAEGRSLPFSATDLAEMLRAFSDGLSQLAAVDVERTQYYDRLAMLFFGLIERAMGGEPAPPEPKTAKRRS